jgi:hypothetical protein
VLALVMCAGAASAAPQDRAQRRGGPDGGERVSAAEIQRLFDAYVVMRAQQELELTDEQYPRFLAAVKNLQAARQRGIAEHARIIQQLRNTSEAPAIDVNQARALLKALADVDARTADDVREALAAIDQVLDLRQQIRFRVFEEQMERRKIELLVRARQANRQRNSP